MKKGLLITLLSVVLLSIISTTSYSNNMPCEGNNPCDTWTSATITLYDCVTVQYFWAICDGKVHIKFGDIFAEEPCVVVHPWQLLNDATLEILQQDFMDVIVNNIQPGNCFDQIYTYSRACYYWVEIVTHPKALLPCYEESCCISGWRICRGWDNVLTYTRLSSSAGTPCIEIPIQNCFQVCDEE